MENKKGLVIAIVMLSVMLIASIGFIVYDKFFANNNSDEEYVNVIDDVSIDVNKLYRVGEILDKFDKAFSTNDSKYFGYIYSTKVIEVRDFDKGAALYASIYSDLVRSNTEQTISNGIVKNRYEDIFGRALEYKSNNLELGDNIKVSYDAANEIYKYTASITNNDNKNGYLAKNIKTKLKDDLVVVTRKVFYVEYSSLNANIYTNASKTTKVGTVRLSNGEVSLDEVIGKYGSKLNTYDVTFKLGNTDEYNFYKIERTK